MITQFFKSKRKVINLPYIPTPTNTSKWVGHTNLTEEQRAAKRGLSTDVYRHRVAQVARAQIGVKLFLGETAWPVKMADAIEHGKVLIKGIVRHYDDYGDVEWHEPPFILSVSPLKDQTKIINCTSGWVSKEEPVFPGVEC
jgi:hypothetical protein